MRRSLYEKRQRSGYFYMIPFLTGFIFLYLTPLLRSLYFSFCQIQNTQEGLTADFIGLGNYKYILGVDPDFTATIVGSLKSLLVSVPAILLFSFFVAVVLNQNFRGRTIARSLMFLPVVLTSGVILLLQYDIFFQSAASGVSGMSGDSDAPSNLVNLSKIVLDMLPVDAVGIVPFVESMVAQTYHITISSGVQILIYLAGLQSIPPSLFEASSIEGATSWESFWKITFPMLSPLIVVNLVYTLVDQMCGLHNPVMQSIYYMTFAKIEFARAAAMSWIYMVIAIAFMAVSTKLVSRFVYYEN